MLNNREADEQAAALWTLYEQGKIYQSAIGIAGEYPRCVRFFEGRQWAPSTPATRNLPRPVINVTKMIVRSKVAAILGTRAKIVYRSPDGADTEEIRAFNEFADYMAGEMGQDRIDKQAVRDGAIKGTYIYHYYWDTEAVGQNGQKEGGLRVELLNPLNVIFANPCERDEQKQAWILFASRQPVEAVRAQCDRGLDPLRIVPDEELSDGTAEQEGSHLCTVLTRYYRKNGEVYWERATKDAMVNRGKPLSPDVSAARAGLHRLLASQPAKRAIPADGTGDSAQTMDPPNTSLLDDINQAPAPKEERIRACLYPLVVGQYEEREGTIYGMGEVENIIPNQRAVNFLLAMMILNAQTMAWGKYVVDPQALRHQKINNDPGQVLTDYSKNGNGIRRMPENGLSGQPMEILDSLMRMTRVVTGSSEVMTGETLGSSLSGAAIAELQSQALLPIDDLRDSFWLVKEKQGRVLAQAFILYYRGKSYTAKKTRPDGTTAAEIAAFDGSRYAHTAFNVVAEAVSGTKASAVGDITMLDNLLKNRYIDVETYLTLYPKDALTNRRELLAAVRRRRVSGTEPSGAEPSGTSSGEPAVSRGQLEAEEKAARLEQENQRLRVLVATGRVMQRSQRKETQAPGAL